MSFLHFSYENFKFFSPGCSKCLKRFPRDGFASKPDFSGYDENSFTPRNRDDHISNCERHRIASTLSQQKEIEQEFGVRYSELCRLPYYDPIRCHLIDPMHCLLLGIAKHTLKVWIEVLNFQYFLYYNCYYFCYYYYYMTL